MMDITQFVVSHRDEALLLGDYHTYQTQLSRRLLALRKRLGRSTPKNAKFAPKSPVTAEDIGRNHEFLHLQLLTAERAWAHAMHLKSVHAEDNAGKGITGSTRRQIISWLHKAATYARELVTLLSDKTASSADDNDILEAQAYAHSLAGAEEFEKRSGGTRSGDAQAQKQAWHDCLVNFSVARVIYNSLLRATQKELFKELLASTIDPSIRYAAYQSRLPRTLAVSTVARQYFPRGDAELINAVEKLDPDALSDESKTSSAGKASGAGNVPNTITWRSRTANIVDASIGQALAAVTAAESRLSVFLSSATAEISAREKAAAYDDVLIASQDAADATRRAIDELEKEKVDEGDPRMQDLRVTSLAVNYDLIGWRVGRNRVLIGADDGASIEGAKPKKPKRPRKDGKEWVEKEESNGRKLARLRDRVVLYDAVLQSIDSVKELRGAVRDTTFFGELEAKRAYFQALKCLNIGYSQAVLSNATNALALFARAEGLATKAIAVITPSAAPNAPPKLDIHPSQAQSLHQKLEGLVLQYRGLVELHKFSENSATAAQKNMTTAAPIVERLNEYPANGVDLSNLVTYPPKLKPVPVKPLFLDVAWNYIDYPGRAKEVVQNGTAAVDGAQPESQQEEEKKKPAKRGWFGFGRS